MSTEVQRRRGTTVEHATFTGAEGEITVDTTKCTAVVHDGQTPGGHPLAKEGAVGGLTSVGLAAPAGFAVSGSPLTANGSITLSFASGYSLPTDARQGIWDSALRSVDLTYTPATRTIGNTGGQDAVLPVFSATAAGLAPSAAGASSTDVLQADGQWVTPSGGGGGGGLTSVGLAAPAGFAVSGSPLTANGSITLSFASGYSLPTDAQQLNWDVAATLAGTAIQPSALAAAIGGITPASIGAATAAQGSTADTALQSVDLGYTDATRTITNTGGQDVVLPVATTANAGLQPAMGFTSLTYAASYTVDMQALNGQLNTLELQGAITISYSNMANGRQTRIRFKNTSFTPSAFSFPSDTTFLCDKPANLAAAKSAIIEFTCYSGNSADVVAIYTAQP